MKFSKITAANLAKAANPNVDFDGSVAANLAKAANPAGSDEQVSKISDFSSGQRHENDPQEAAIRFDVGNAANPANSANPNVPASPISKISDFSKGNTRENAKFASVRCSDCQHALPATATDPHSWHSCDRGLKGWWGMAPHRCERWDGKAERIAKEEEARLAEEERQRRKEERRREEIEKNIRLTLFSSFNDLVTGASVWAGLELTQERIKVLKDPDFEQERMQWPALQKFDRAFIEKAIDGLKAILEVY